MAEQAPFYIFTAFVFTYGTTVLHSSRDLLLTALLSATILSFVTVPPSAHLWGYQQYPGIARSKRVAGARVARP